jgi:hypothetical protein
LILFFLGLFTLIPGVYAQNILPRDYFSSPLDSVLLVTGTFGELRLNHFHSGVDFRTQEKEGRPVYAAADGIIVRIRVSPFGFGHALYINHPNGFTTVYGHLQKFSPEIERYIRKEQYKQEAFDVDVFPRDSLKVKRGDVIAHSGNSGASFGPHLHFEIRSTRSERPINPLLFNFPLKDTLPPFINLFMANPVGNRSLINDTNVALTFAVAKDTLGIYHLKSNDTLRIFGKASFGLQGFDYFYNHRDQNGYYSLALYDNSDLKFRFAADSFAFDESRYINACIDYQAYYLTGERIMQTNLLPNNRFSLYKRNAQPGTIDFRDGELHRIEMVIADVAGNEAKLVVFAMGYKPVRFPVISPSLLYDTTAIFSYNHSNTFRTPEITVEIPGDALYDSIAFGYSYGPRLKNTFSAAHLLGDPLVPLQQRITVSIKADSLPVNLRDKALLVRVTDGKRSPAGGSWKNGYVTAKTLFFGYYAIGVDITPPTIKPTPLPFKPRSRKHHRQPQPKRTKLSFIITDNFSGIASYRATINGKWALLEYDAKNDLITYNYDDLMKRGKNSFRLTVTDEKGNKASYARTISR